MEYTAKTAQTEHIHSMILTISVLQTEPGIIANSVDPGGTAHYEPSHQNLHYLPFNFHFLTGTPTCITEVVHIQI